MKSFQFKIGYAVFWMGISLTLLAAACSNSEAEPAVQAESGQGGGSGQEEVPAGQGGASEQGQLPAGQGGASEQGQLPAGQGAAGQGEAPGQEVQGRVERRVNALTLELRPVVEGNNQFALSLYGQVIQAQETEGQNVFLSPFSVSAALGMTYAGANGDTAREMRDVLAIQADDDPFHHEFGALIDDLSGDKPGRGYQLYVANRLFGQQDWEFLDDFLALNQQCYGASLQQVDYCGQPEEARNIVNDWVAEQTDNRIDELFPEGQFSCMTALTLVNAIYFKADWAEQFDPASTADRPFRLLSGETVDVPTMSAEIELRVAESPDLTLLDLPYQDDELSMIIMLPREPDGLPALEASLELDAIEQLVAAAADGEFLVELPRFDIRSRPPVKQALIDMGMASAFSPDADFSKMAPPPPLYIDDVVHEAFVSVDERGTEAAAATGVEMTFWAAPLPIQVAHPFLFLIRDRLTESILFMGRVLDPSQAPQ